MPCHYKISKKIPLILAHHPPNKAGVGHFIIFGPLILAMYLRSNPQLIVLLSQSMHSYTVSPSMGSIKRIDKNPREANPLGDVISPL
jgi:hypothetical protein